MNSNGPPPPAPRKHPSTPHTSQTINSYTEAQVTHNDIERFSAQFGDASADGGVDKVVDHLGRSTVMPNSVDWEDLRQESSGQYFAVVPNGEVLQLCSNRVLVNDIDLEREGGLFQSEP